MKASDLDRLATAYHESGHAAVARALGRRLAVVSVRPGRHFSGIAVQRGISEIGWHAGPALLWPPGDRRVIEEDIAFSLAGPEAERLVDPLLVLPHDHDEPAVKKALRKPPALPKREAEHLAALEQSDDPIEHDYARAERLAVRLVGPEGAHDYLQGMKAQVRQLVHSRPTRRAIRRLADALLERGAVSGRVATRILGNWRSLKGGDLIFEAIEDFTAVSGDGDSQEVKAGSWWRTPDHAWLLERYPIKFTEAFGR